MNSDFDVKATSKKYVTIFASGGGTNAENCMRYFKYHPTIQINLIITNKADAGVILKAEENHIPCCVFLKEDWEHVTPIIETLERYQTDLIVLAGYLALLPPDFIHAYKHRVINIHPALLPKYGGKGMYGARVHTAVIANHESQTGITIHEVDEIYDNGKIIFQKAFDILPDDSPASIERKVRKMEHEFLPQVIENLFTRSE